MVGGRYMCLHFPNTNGYSACAVKNRDEIRHIFWWYSGATFPFYQFLQKQCYNKHNMYVFHHYYPKNPRSVNVVAFLAQGEFEVNIHRKTRFGSKWLLWERERNKNLCQRNALAQSTTWTGEISRNIWLLFLSRLCPNCWSHIAILGIKWKIGGQDFSIYF